ncbi:hypothetical protein F7725_006510, partial [Dissostichus mawsoni]
MSLFISHMIHIYIPVEILLLGWSDEDNLALTDMEGHEDERLCGKWRVACGLRLLKTLLMGQVCSLLICGTAVSCQYLADAKTKWWKYLLMGVADVEANYTVVKAYQYTTLTSIQLLDCFVIPVLMVLSWFFLKTRFRPVHLVSVGVLCWGSGRWWGPTSWQGATRAPVRNLLFTPSSVVLGDGLVLLSAVLYAISNVCQEQTVKNLSRIEFLGMMGLFGTLISGVQLAVLETHAVAAIKWDFHTCKLTSCFVNLRVFESLWFGLYALCMYSLYSFMPVVVKMTSATAVNLSLLTADLFSLFCGLFLFHYSFSTLYIISFVVIMVGFVMFNAVPTYTALPGSGSNEEENPPEEEESSSDRLLSAGPEAQREPERRDTKRGENQRPSETPTLERSVSVKRTACSHPVTKGLKIQKMHSILPRGPQRPPPWRRSVSERGGRGGGRGGGEEEEEERRRKRRKRGGRGGRGGGR